MSRPIRQSSRLSAKRNLVPTVPITVPPARQNKRQKTVTQASAPAKPSVPRVDDFRKVKGRRGKLRLMTEIPVDTLLEVFSHVEPLDLLHLSWATKDLHALINASRNSFLWTRAYENLQIRRPPACPPGKNIAHYTNLLFGRACQYCGTNQVGKVIHWAALVRLCSRCAPDKLLHAWGPDIDQQIAPLCPSQWISKSGLPRTCYVIKSDYERHKQKLAQCKDEAQKVEYKAKAHADKQATHTASQLCDQWYRSQEINRLSTAEIIRRKRRDAIIAKLQDAGYAEELRYGSINFLPIVRVPAELTEKAWDKMKDELIDLMEYKRQEMRKANITHALQLRVNTLDRVIQSTMADHFILPHTSYIATREPFQALFKALPLEERVTEEQMRALATPEMILQMTETWRREADILLLGLLSKLPVLPNAEEAIDRTPLELATTFFKCNWCTEPISYPRILMHRCLRHRRSKEPDEEEDDDDRGSLDSGADGEEVEAMEAENDNEQPTRNTVRTEVTMDSVWNNMSSWFRSGWNEGNDQIFVDEEATNFAKKIVEACGEDPNTTTFTRMEELNPRLECVRCSAKSKTKTRNRPVMNWTTALLHDIEIHYEDTPSTSPGWKLLTDATDISAAAQAESKMGKKWRWSTRKCNRCPCFVMESSLNAHLRQSHNLNFGEDEDMKLHYHLPLDTTLKRAPYSVRI
ncbi:hypothetical protein M413DRAFT_437932 [Hebeloma cylindrosporum]|uniref:F-box domain-containing protein n=1 Tax=Hebeloma cylindrosporum TaxID=76867 RepID=A0A0C2Z6E4_HEBCY|nr:hypothetical protein M413DRAFT_437932 [Hebeloma cylindrosporum h7]